MDTKVLVITPIWTWNYSLGNERITIAIFKSHYLWSSWFCSKFSYITPKALTHVTQPQAIFPTQVRGACTCPTDLPFLTSHHLAPPSPSFPSIQLRPIFQILVSLFWTHSSLKCVNASHSTAIPLRRLEFPLNMMLPSRAGSRLSSMPLTELLNAFSSTL